VNSTGVSRGSAGADPASSNPYVKRLVQQ